MAIDADTLLSKTSAQLRAIRASYVASRKAIDRSYSTRPRMLATDTRRCNDAIQLIDSILRVRNRPHKALKGV